MNLVKHVKRGPVGETLSSDKNVCVFAITRRPLNYILTWQKKRQVIKRLSALGWANKSIEEVFVYYLSSV